jgi:hypothetical protein
MKVKFARVIIGFGATFLQFNRSIENTAYRSANYQFRCIPKREQYRL